MESDRDMSDGPRDLNTQDLGVDPSYLGKPTKGWVVLLWALLLIGFPTLGMFFFYKDAQNRIAGKADPFVRQIVPQILGTGDRELLEELATVRFDREKLDRDWPRWQSEFGLLRHIESLEPIDTVAGGAEDDMVWQLVTYRITAIFEKQPGQVNITAARRTTLHTDWRIERLSVEPTH
ncbi:MAG: hypothetical protein KF812_01915 [Fimbriimonadaceae bacterium]|nr:hypothetical protein [Fimbriimonadaceae bacterium]